MPGTIEINDLPAQLAFAVREHVTLETISAKVGESFGAILRHAGEVGARIDGPPFVLYPEMSHGEFEVIVCMPVALGARAGGGVELLQLQPSEGAILLHKGPYSTVGADWGRLTEWVASKGRHPGGPFREVYLNSPQDTSPRELLTQLVVPLGP